MDEPHQTLDLAALRLLTHPLRRRIQQELHRGPVTATSLARALDESTGLTSYHLRELAKHGFVEEVPDKGQGRERWWREVPRDRRFVPRSEQTAEMRAVVEEVQRQQLAEDFTRFLDAQRDSTETGPWADAFPFSFGTVDVTVAEFREFFEEYIALLHRYKRQAGEDRPDARTVQVRLFAWPDSG